MHFSMYINAIQTKIQCSKCDNDSESSGNALISPVELLHCPSTLSGTRYNVVSDRTSDLSPDNQCVMDFCNIRDHFL